MAAERAAWLFVVKLWAERRASADAPPVWRGRVDDVRAGTRRYFTSLAQLREYLSDRLEAAPPDQEGAERAPAKPRRARQPRLRHDGSTSPDGGPLPRPHPAPK